MTDPTPVLTREEQLVALKARAYDLIVHRDLVTAEIQQVTQQIAQLETV